MRNRDVTPVQNTRNHAWMCFWGNWDVKPQYLSTQSAECNAFCSLSTPSQLLSSSLFDRLTACRPSLQPQRYRDTVLRRAAGFGRTSRHGENFRVDRSSIPERERASSLFLHNYGIPGSKLAFSTNLFHRSQHPRGLPSRTILDRTYSAQRFFIFSYFSFFFISGRAVD